MEGRLASRDLAYDLQDTDDESSWQAPQAYLEDHGADPALMVESSDWRESSEARLQDAMADLDDRSRDILARRWLAENKATLHELAAQYEVSAERIRQLEQNAMKKLRVALAA
jgi:RNA polymerase sigma-32 factor